MGDFNLRILQEMFNPKASDPCLTTSQDKCVVSYEMHLHAETPDTFCHCIIHYI